MNKPKYVNGDRIQIALDGYTNNIIEGTVIGIASEHVIDLWIVRFDKRLDHYPFDAATIQHTFMRKIGDNKPFLCETGRFTYDD